MVHVVYKGEDVETEYGFGGAHTGGAGSEYGEAVVSKVYVGVGRAECDVESATVEDYGESCGGHETTRGHHQAS
jgi:hypothetical protein